MAEIKVCDGAMNSEWDRGTGAPTHDKGELVQAHAWVTRDEKRKGVAYSKHQCMDHLRQTLNNAARGWLSTEGDELKIVMLR